MLKIKDIIKKLQELNDDNYIVSFEDDPISDRMEQLNGIGYETTKNRYTIVLEEKIGTFRRYENRSGFIEYIDKKENKNE